MHAPVQRERKTKIKNEPIEKIEADLSRPLPKLSIRGMLAAVVIVLVVGWGIEGTDARPQTLAEGVPNIVDFISRLLPPEFEFVRNTERVYTLFPFSVRQPDVVLPADILRVLRPATEAQLENIEGDQQVVTLYRDARRFIYYSPEDIPGYGSVDFDAASIEELPYIIGANEYIHIEAQNNDPYPVPEGYYFASRFAVPQGQSLVSGRYLVNSGEIFLGLPVAIPEVIVTVQMALIGTIGAFLLSIPFGLLAARNVSPNRFIYQTTRLIMNANRAVPELIYALIFVSAVGLGPFPGVLALIVGSFGSLGKVFAESIEAIDPDQVQAVRATGAKPLQVFNYAVMPQATPLIVSYSLLVFEANVRAATILGIVGAGGIGFLLDKYFRLFQYQRLMGAVILIIVFVTLIDRASDAIRKRII
jgi:phosphonate transport system permease protein